MTVRRTGVSTRVKAAVAAAALGVTGVTGVVAAAPADALPGAVCMTHQQFFDALHPATRRDLYRRGKHKWGVQDVRCSHGWAVALATVKDKDGKRGYGYTVNEHRDAQGVWHEVNRVKPCREHKIPKKIYTQFCESN